LRILVSGAGGFIGRHIALAMARRGHDVVALVRRTWPAILAQQQDLRVERVDLAAIEGRLPAGFFDAVVHCAAAIPSAVPDDLELTRVNIEGTRRLFQHAIDVGVDTIIFCSSMAVYGRIAVDVVDPDTPINDPSAYGRSKLAGERLLAGLCQTRPSLRALSIRLPGVVGVGSHHNFLSDTITHLFAGRRVDVRNPDALFNNAIHIDDLADFVAIVLATLPRGNRVTTIAAAEPVSIRHVVEILHDAAGGRGTIRYRREGHSFLISSEDARALGYQPAATRDVVRRFASAMQQSFSAGA
jgi:nucleoside-diphosphate-sugar epimerase